MNKVIKKGERKVIAFLTWTVLAAAVGYFANERGRSGIGWGIAAAFFSPLLCFIILLVLKNNRR